jgi:hypothetical protein
MTTGRKWKIKQRPAPRLASGKMRVRLYGRLPDSVKEGLRGIALAEGKSMSWVIEEVLIDYFVLDVPKYKLVIHMPPIVQGSRRKNVLPMRRKA